jgi:hypothetical protein
MVLDFPFIQIVTVMSFERVTDLDDERRCKGILPNGEQCRNVSVEGSERCVAHGGPKDDPRDDMQDYLTEQFRRRISIDCPEGQEVKLLRDNLIDLNAIIAAHRNKMEDEASMLANYGKMTDLMMQAERLTNTLHRLSVTSGLLLARPALIRWGQSIVNAVSDVIQDKYEGWEDDLIDLSDRIAGIIIETKNEEGEKP